MERKLVEAEQRSGPGPMTRVIGRTINAAVVRFPFVWKVARGPVRRFFDGLAPGWDERTQADSPRFVAPLGAALEYVEEAPARILDVGTGTGAAAFFLAERYPEAEVVGIDVSPEMIAQAEAKAAERGSRVRFVVADAAGFEDEAFDLITMLNMPPFFGPLAALLAPGGYAVNVSSFGSRTPFYTPPGVLERGFGRRGVHRVAAGEAGVGTYYVGRGA